MSSTIAFDASKNVGSENEKKKGENLWLIWNILMLNESLILWSVAAKMEENKRKENNTEA